MSVALGKQIISTGPTQSIILTGTLSAGSTSLQFTNIAIKPTSYVKCQSDTYGVEVSDIIVSTGKVILKFDSQPETIKIRVVIS